MQADCLTINTFSNNMTHIISCIKVFHTCFANMFVSYLQSLPRKLYWICIRKRQYTAQMSVSTEKKTWIGASLIKRIGAGVQRWERDANYRLLASSLGLALSCITYLFRAVPLAIYLLCDSCVRRAHFEHDVNAPLKQKVKQIFCLWSNWPNPLLVECSYWMKCFCYNNNAYIFRIKISIPFSDWP